MKNNPLTYAYKGLVATILFLTFQKKKIRPLFMLDDEMQDVQVNTGDAFVNRDDATKKLKADMINAEKQRFRYKAKRKDGKVINSTFDAYNIDQAKKFLADEGLDIININQRSKSDVDIVIGKPLSVGEMSFALTQLSTYIKAGISLVDSVRILAKQTQKAEKRKIYEMLIFDLLSGDSFSDALEKQPKVFPKLLVNMVRSSELTGDLPYVLDDMANYYTSIDKTRKEIKSAMTYPAVVMTFAIIVVAFVLIWVVPQYEGMFAGYGVDLPTITVYTLKFSEFLQTKGWQVLIIIIAIVILYLYLFNNIRSFRLMMQKIYLKIPVLGNIIVYSEISMFTKTFASLLNHGVYITESMDVLLKVSENEVYKNIIRDTVNNLNAGGKISESFKNRKEIPIVAYEMIVTGENTGKLGTMMEKVYNYYDDLYSNAIGALKSLIEPVLIIFLAGSVGLIVLAIILPMFQMYESLS